LGQLWVYYHVKRLSYSLCDKFNLYSSDRSLCPLCLEWFLPLARQQDCILEYILPTKPKRAVKSLKTREMKFAIPLNFTPYYAN